MQQIETNIERLDPLASATLNSSTMDPFEAFIALGDLFRHPREVLAHPGLSVAEKHSVLGSWASDARVLDSCPAFPCLPNDRSEPVLLDKVLAALQALDGSLASQTAAEASQPQFSPMFRSRWQHRAPARQHLN